MPTITNTMNRPWEVPGAAGMFQPAPIIIMPGMKAAVDDKHWEAITKGNAALEALLDGEHLLVNGQKKVSEDDLVNPETPAMPEDLKAENDSEKVKVESTTELVEKEIPSAAPSAPKGRKGNK